MSVATPSRVGDRLRKLADEAVSSPGFPDAPSHPALAKLRSLGTDLWLDTGNLEEARSIWHRETTSLTTNNTLANQVVQTGILDGVVKETIHDLIEADPNIPEEMLVMELGFVVNCHIALRLVKAFGAMVSVELHPSVAEDIDRTMYYAERYYAVCPERFYVKIPMSPEGFCSVARARAKGIPINYTLGFSARQNYLAAMISNPAFVNVFLGRLNQLVSENHAGDGKYVGEKAAMASQVAVRELREAGRTSSRQIAASMRTGAQIADLAGMDVFTMPVKAATEFLDSNPAPGQIESHVGSQFEVTFFPGVAAEQFEAFWTVDDSVKAMAEELNRRGAGNLAGEDIRQADADHGVGLFHRFTLTEVVDLRAKGKIPELARWKDERVAVDDLMTQSALQSFAVDQAALDDHLRSLIRSG